MNGLRFAATDRANEGRMVALVLIGVAAGEFAHGLGEHVALPHVGIDGYGVTGASMRPGQGIAAGNGDSTRTGAIRSVVGMSFMSRN
jgi:hypothetical protein